MKLNKILLTLAILQNIAIFAINAADLQESKRIAEEQKIEVEIKQREDLPTVLPEERQLTKVNNYRSKCLEQHLPKDLSQIIQAYDPIESNWECEKTFLQGWNRLGFPRNVCLLDDSKLAASCAGIINVWDLKSYECLTTIKDEEICGNPLCSLSGNKLAYLSDQKIKIWNLEANRCEAILKDENYLALYPLAGNKLISVGETIKIWDVNSKECINTFKDPNNIINTSCLLSETKLACGFENGTIKILNLNTGNFEQELKGHTKNICALYSLPKNKLISSDWDNTIKIWNLIDSNCEKTINLDYTIFNFCLLPENKLIMVPTKINNTIEIWNINSWTQEKIISIDHLYVLYGKESNKIIFKTTNNTKEIWSYDEKEIKETLNDELGVLISTWYECSNLKYEKTIKCSFTTTTDKSAELFVSPIKSICLLPENKFAIVSDHAVSIWSQNTQFIVPDEKLMKFIDDYKIESQNYNSMDMNTARKDIQKITINLLHSIKLIINYLKELKDDKLENAKTVLANRGISTEILNNLSEKLQEESNIINAKIQENDLNQALNDALDQFDEK